MPKMIGLMTDWLNIGKSGPTVDGRVIKPEWLKDAAKTYDPDEYTAVANAEHWYGNYGSARELRTTKDDKDRVVLQARIRPNANYLAQNAEGKRLFFSMELTHDFAKTGKTYLTGLATTDRPASLGTSEAHFSIQDNEQVFRGGSEEFSTSALQVVEDQKKELIPAVVAAIKEAFSNHKTKTLKKEEFDMTEEQVQAFTEGQKAISDGLAGLVTLLTPKTDAEKTAAAEAAAAEAAKTALKKKDTEEDIGSDKTDFAAFKKSVEKLNDSLDAFGKKLDDAVEGKFGKKVPASEGNEEDASFV